MGTMNEPDEGTLHEICWGVLLNHPDKPLGWVALEIAKQTAALCFGPSGDAVASDHDLARSRLGMDRKLLDKVALDTLRQQELAEREAEERQRREADRLRAELVVLEAIARHGVYWPGDER